VSETSIEKRAWELMVLEHGDVVHEVTGLADALLPRYRDRAMAEAQE
jgi:hypothetical protein